MKKMIFTCLCTLAALTSGAQLALNRTFTPVGRLPYFELVNSGKATSVDLQCYSLVTYFKTQNERGFYVINFPAQKLALDGMISIGSEEAPQLQGDGQRLRYDWTQLSEAGLLQRFVIHEAGNLFRNTERSSPYNWQVMENDFSDHVVLLFNGSTLVDASTSLDASRQLPDYIRRLSNLSFTNGCGSLATIRFASLQQMYPQILQQPQARNEAGQFREFEIQRNNASVQVAWQTMRERNIRGYELERRAQNGSWTTVAYIAARATEQNGDQALQYLYGDTDPLAGQSSYRLRQVDVNGRAYYSPVKTIDAFGNIDKMVVYPNPSTDGVANIAFGNVNALRDVQLLDINGRIVQQWVSVNNRSQQITNLRRGQYFVRVIDQQTGTMQTQKLIVQ